MQKKLRHSKFRNTGILFELLTKQITADILAGKDESSARDLLFKYFKENTELGKEWRLYGFLLNEKIRNENQAERFLSVITEQRKKLKNTKLAEEKYNLIKEMKRLYPMDQFLKTGINNYRLLASVYKIFENISSDNIKFDVKEIFQAKNCIVENLTDNQKKPLTESDELIQFYQQQNEDIRLLSYKLLVDGVNKKYNTVLNDNQKIILREYINNVSNTNNLSVFVCKKIDEIKEELLTTSNKILDNDVIKIKITEVVKQLDRIKPTNGIVKDNQIMTILLSYELLNEIQTQLKKEEAPREQI